MPWPRSSRDSGAQPAAPTPLPSLPAWLSGHRGTGVGLGSLAPHGLGFHAACPGGPAGCRWSPAPCVVGIWRGMAAGPPSPVVLSRSPRRPTLGPNPELQKAAGPSGGGVVSLQSLQDADRVQGSSGCPRGCASSCPGPSCECLPCPPHSHDPGLALSGLCPLGYSLPSWGWGSSG